MGLFDIFTGKPAKDAASKNTALYNTYKTDSLGYLDKGLATSDAATREGIAAFNPLGDLGAKYGGASNLYLDSLGVNGASGNARATGAFQTGPGYEFMRDEATNNALRKANATGIGLGGNAVDAVTRLSSNLANQEYGNWQGRLAGFVPQEASAVGGAASGKAAGWNALSNLYQGDASNRANVAGTVASGLASSNNQAAQAQMQGSSNFWSGLMNLGGAAIGAAFPRPKVA